ncbi:MAG TPA: hypothetical protein VN625_06925 [Desulfuromonadaceae bacterium]|nr:hypothetical protein [Desulfuromonadaceae bacterium]
MKTKLALYLALFVAAGLFGCSTTKNHPPGFPVRYYNAEYDLTFYFPESWKGYSVLVDSWDANQPDVMTQEHGPIIVLRHPLWRTNDLYQDIPIMVFTHKQWAEQHEGKFFPFAGGCLFELWHNTHYVFGVYSRYRAYDEVKCWQEAEDIIAANQMIQPFSRPLFDQ